jgi:hypothetical protein
VARVSIIVRFVEVVVTMGLVMAMMISIMVAAAITFATKVLKKVF